MERRKRKRFEQLPEGLQFVVSDYLESRDVARLACVSRSWVQFGTAFPVARLLAHLSGRDAWLPLLRCGQRFRVLRQHRRWKITLQEASELCPGEFLRVAGSLERYSARSRQCVYHWCYLEHHTPKEVCIFVRVPL
jgi:hypothetical protein